MARDKFSSPKLVLRIDAAAFEEAVRCNHRACVIAKAIEDQYPHLTNISVTTATIRASDRKEGFRYTWLPTTQAQQLLLAFDQGWPIPFGEIVLRRAAVITPIIRSAIKQAESKKAREERRQELEAREASGETLTPVEKRALSRIRNNKLRERPDTPGRPEVKVDRIGVQVHGAAPLVGPEKANPKLLPSSIRVGGGHLADPGKAFDDALAFERQKIEAEIRAQLLTEGAVNG
jgi:hypothetical protein